MKKYRRTSIVVEAEQFNHKEKTWPKGVFELSIAGACQGYEYRDETRRFKIYHLDWIVRDQGFISTMSNDEFVGNFDEEHEEAPNGG